MISNRLQEKLTMSTTSLTLAATLSLVALSPEKPAKVTETTEKDGVKYQVFSDAKFQAANGFKLAFTLDETTQTKYKGYGINLADTNSSGTWQLPHPGTFVIDKASIIQAVWVDKDYTKRTDPCKVVAAVKNLK